MKQVCITGSKMSGSVGSHSSHIVGYTGGQNPQPIYCSGHSVTGTQTVSNNKVFIGGVPLAVKGNSGTSTCPCDGKGYTNTAASSKIYIKGQPVVLVGDDVNIHGQGTGKMTSGNSRIMSN